MGKIKPVKPLLKTSLAAGIILLAGCAAVPKGPQLGKLYNPSASHLEAERNPVIVIPGILGSRLVDSETGTTVWGAFGGDFADPATAEGARLAALPMREGVPVQQIADGVVPDGALDRFQINFWFGNFRLSAYYNILRALGVGGYKDEDIGGLSDVDYGQGHFTCFQFDYDWRLDLAGNAKRLDAFIREKHDYVTKEIARRFGETEAEVKFDIVAHSMGGLLSRYYLRYGGADLPDKSADLPVTWAGARHVQRLIMVGTPNAGSVSALQQLVEGSGGQPFVPRYGPAILGTMPAMYQLLPQSRHRPLVRLDDRGGEPLDLYDPDLWIELGWGLASPAEETMLRLLLPDVPDQDARRRIALDHLRKCLARAKRMWQALNVPASPPEGLALYLFAGDAVETEAVVGVRPGTGEISVLERAPGDGSVLRSSALMDERVGGEWSPKLVSPIEWRQVVFFFRDHLGITKDPVFTDNLLYLLLEQPDEPI